MDWLDALDFDREAAAIYWSCWANLPITVVRQDLARVPEHWLRFGTRHSPITVSTRSAINPANAILNYLYAILEAETRTACLTLGLDPGLGIWHADYRSRDSFVLDLMEAARPDVDSHVLKLLTTRTFTRREVGETSKGVCRLLPPLAQELAQTTSKWREAIAPHAEHVVRLLARSPGTRIPKSPATPLTRENRMRANPPRRRAARPSPEPVLCKRCHAYLPIAIGPTATSA
ncbi:MAG: CRISPR-associated endonuclease Cas1 [Gaiellales bacterium]